MPAGLAAPANAGHTGLVNMPSARIEPEGVVRFGYSGFDPYYTFWGNITMLPRLELTARYTRIAGIPVFGGNSGYGDYKDKAFDAKLLAVRESRYVPEFSIGTQDFLGTGLLSAEYVALSKQFGDIDVTLGYGNQRLNGYFGGIRYTPRQLSGIALLAEYDATDYAHDFDAQTSGAAQRAGGWTYGLDYTWGWLGAKLAYQRGDVGFAGYVTIPLDSKEFIPKFDEPPPFAAAAERVDLERWRQDPVQAHSLVRALEAQGYKNVQVTIDNGELRLGLAHPRVSLVGRAVGRAARTALLMAPLGTQRIKITYYSGTDLPVVTYLFTDLQGLEAYFQGKFGYKELLQYFTVSYADPLVNTEWSDAAEPTAQASSASIDDVAVGMRVLRNEDGHVLSFKQEGRRLGSFQVVPFNLGLYFNDPSGAYRYDTFALAKYTHHLSRGLFFDAGARLQLWENVSGVTQESNSLLPHVRTDVADYKSEGRLRLNHAVVNQFLHLRPRVYGRLTAGYYEEMFGGLGGQLLYMPRQQPWATDLSVDWVRQREPGATLAFRDYRTVTALASVHYRIPRYGLTFSLRGGRFLAQDAGVRMEFKRRFASGIRVGAWYTLTDGNDVTGPGSPGAPYHDKGVFLSIPLGSMLPKDSSAVARFAISPWTRDVGQMVRSPGDLYTIMEEALLLDKPGMHLLTDFEK